MGIICISYWDTHYFTLVNKACFGPCESWLSKILVHSLNVKSHIYRPRRGRYYFHRRVSFCPEGERYIPACTWPGGACTWPGGNVCQHALRQEGGVYSSMHLGSRVWTGGVVCEDRGGVNQRWPPKRVVRILLECFWWWTIDFLDPQ